MNQDSSVSTVIGQQAGCPVVPSQQRQEIVLFSKMSKPSLGFTKPHVQWVLGALSLGLNHLECEADHSPPSSAPVKNEWNCTSVLPHAFMACFQFRKQVVTLNMLR